MSKENNAALKTALHRENSRWIFEGVRTALFGGTSTYIVEGVNVAGLPPSKNFWMEK